MHKTMFSIVVVLVLVAGIFYYLRQGGIRIELPEIAGEKSNTAIRYTDEGYAPKSITIKRGTEVIFKNESPRDTWPASAMHPTHQVYPETDINKCGKVRESSMLDACRGLKPGESWSFEFDYTGTWGYHDHLNSRHFGSITVE